MKRKRKCSPQTRRLLEAFLDQPRKWQHGYDLSVETGLSSGTLYPILMRLSDRGVLDSRWVESPERGRPRRHTYRLSAEGVAYAREELRAVSDTRTNQTPKVCRT
ncbi:MAG: PadR family transcriptional regulator [Pseudomonadota bacterium]